MNASSILPKDSGNFPLPVLEKKKKYISDISCSDAFWDGAMAALIKT